jgi:hypothetical protein
MGACALIEKMINEHLDKESPIRCQREFTWAWIAKKYTASRPNGSVDLQCEAEVNRVLG